MNTNILEDTKLQEIMNKNRENTRQTLQNMSNSVKAGLTERNYKLYKYRPFSSLLFKELKYNEIYFSSYYELNDPLDLTARINFKPNQENQINYLIYFILKESINFSRDSEVDIKNNSNIINIMKDKNKLSSLSKSLYSKLKEINGSFLSIDTVINEIKHIETSLDVKINIPYFRNEIDRLTEKFFQSSYTYCFSETCTNYLMWSHYASNHNGICLEFSLKYENRFPFIDSINNEDYYSTDLIHKVSYQEIPQTVNFYEFSEVFENEFDCDLIGLSKSRYHHYADELTKVFSIKTFPWEYEKEWRMIEIHFDNLREPEERIKHYPTESLTAIYFGLRIPQKIKDRICKLISSKSDDIKFYDCQLSDNHNLKHIEFNYEIDYL